MEDATLSLLITCTLLGLGLCHQTAEDAFGGCEEAKCIVRPATTKGQQVEGVVRLRQCRNYPTEVGVDLQGFHVNDEDKLHGFHIHKVGNTADACKAAGGHYNPTGHQHGGPKDPLSLHHVGDLGNIREDVYGRVSTLIKVNYVNIRDVMGRTFVIHARRDDLGKGNATDSLTTGNAGPRLACCIIEKTHETEYDYAHCKLGANEIKGDVWLRQLKSGGMTTYALNIRGVPNSDASGLHGFHVHQNGLTTDNCKAAGGHYNPRALDHGGPNDVIRHVGDLGNVKRDKDGRIIKTLSDHLAVINGSNGVSVIGRAIVLHKGRDDLGKSDNPESKKTGLAGPRIACCVIKLSEHGPRQRIPWQPIPLNAAALGLQSTCLSLVSTLVLGYIGLQTLL